MGRGAAPECAFHFLETSSARPSNERVMARHLQPRMRLASAALPPNWPERLHQGTKEYLCRAGAIADADEDLVPQVNLRELHPVLHVGPRRRVRIDDVHHGPEPGDALQVGKARVRLVPRRAGGSRASLGAGPQRDAGEGQFPEPAVEMVGRVREWHRRDEGGHVVEDRHLGRCEAEGAGARGARVHHVHAAGNQPDAQAHPAKLGPVACPLLIGLGGSPVGVGKLLLHVGEGESVYAALLDPDAELEQADDGSLLAVHAWGHVSVPGRRWPVNFIRRVYRSDGHRSHLSDAPGGLTSSASRVRGAHTLSSMTHHQVRRS